MDLGGETNREISLVERGGLGLGDDHRIIKRTLLTGTKKTPAHVQRKFLVPFEYYSQDFLFTEKELENEMGVVHLKGFAHWELGQIHRIGYGNG